MNAKEQALEYAKNHAVTGWTNEQFFGKMAAGGMVINRTSSEVTTAYARREGRTIIVTETTVTTTNEIVNGKVIFNKIENTVEIFRAEI